MTQTLDTPTHDPAQQRVDAWLADFEDGADGARRRARAAGMFAADSFWRDLVAFTWNLKTVEGPDGVADLLPRPSTAPTRAASAPTEPPTEADGSSSAWIEFETAVGRGRGPAAAARRRRGEVAWTLLTTLVRAQGARGAQGRGPARRAPSTAPTATARPGPSSASGRPGSSATRRQPVRAGRRRRPGRHRARRPAAPARRAGDRRSTSTPGPATSGAAATSRCACTTRSGTTTCRTSSSPTTGRCSRPRTRSPTGWSPTPR